MRRERAIPGLSNHPASENVDIDENSDIVDLFKTSVGDKKALRDPGELIYMPVFVGISDSPICKCKSEIQLFVD
jgi:hypothetical protein